MIISILNKVQKNAASINIETKFVQKTWFLEDV